MSNKEILKVKKISSFAVIPTRGTEQSVGYDLYASESTTIMPRTNGLVNTGISIVIPLGYYGRIAPRSSLACKNLIDVGAGVIDPDYRGPVKVVLFNHSQNRFDIEIGDRIAQLIITKVSIPKILEVEELDDTDRGEKGFGSTGK